MQPAFHRKRLAAFGTLMTGATVTMLDQLQRFAERDQPLDVAAEMVRLTLRIASQALFNIDLSDESCTVGQAVATVNKLLSEYLYAPFPPLSIPTPRSVAFRQHVAPLLRSTSWLINLDVRPAIRTNEAWCLVAARNARSQS